MKREDRVDVDGFFKRCLRIRCVRGFEVRMYGDSAFHLIC